MNIFTESEMWGLIESARWNSDHDYNRIQNLFKNLDKKEFKELENFFIKKVDLLHQKFDKAWLSIPGIDVSDDGWSDLTAEVVGRGEDFYNSITAEKLQKIAIENDYEESFSYCF